MKRSYAIILVCLSFVLCVLGSCISREAAEQNDPAAQMSESVEYCTVTFYQDGMVREQIAVKYGETIPQPPEGESWQDAGGHTVDLAAMTVTGDMALYAWRPVSLRAESVQYMTGENNMFRPNDVVTRGQAAQILSSLLDEEWSDPGGREAFTDVTKDDESYASVEEIFSLGIMNGYGDGTFRPNEPITRGEMVTALCRMMDVDEIMALAFDDVTAEHWTVGSVAGAMAKGWLSGYEDGEFYPDAPLTRAQAAVLIDRALGKSPDKTAIDIACAASPYRDVSKKHWAYYDIVYSSLGSGLLASITDLEADGPGLAVMDGGLCHINAENQMDYFQKGFHTIADGLDSDGLYYAPEDGYFLQRNTPGLKELDGSMFYVARQDGPFVTNSYYGYLYFGDNGRYTSGDVAVDGYVDAIMAGIIQGDTNNLLNEEKLRAAYDYILNGDYDYMSRNTGWRRGSTDWALECARTMYESKRGSCYYWAASFLYLARRLGFQAYPVCGGVNENNALHAWVMIDHGEQIDTLDVNSGVLDGGGEQEIDPDEYIYDIELDWAYRTGAHGRVPIREGRNLFKQTRGHAVIIYIFPGATWSAPPSNEDALGETGGAEENGDLYEGVEGVDYTITYTDNGDGTILVTITYLTGSQAGTSTSYTIPASEYTGPLEPVQPTAEPTMEPVQPTAEPTTEPTAEPTMEPVTEPPTEPTTEPTAEPVTEPTAEPVTEPTAEPSGGEQTGGEQTGGEQTGGEQPDVETQPGGEAPAADVDPGTQSGEGAA